MRQANCYRIAPDEISWSGTETQSMAERELFTTDTVQLKECRSVASTSWPSKARTLYLLSAGELKFENGQVLSQGDLYWCNVDGESFVSGASGASFYCIEPLQGIGQEIPSQKISSAELPWEHFADPADRPTQPVQVLMGGSVSALRTRFDATFIAGEHWHDFDTLYFISDGRMQFGDEGWFEQGEIRAVHGGHSYGPERPGTDGVEFVLVSVGGPVVLHWSDLEPPP
ncbi:MAG: hypothetical protein ACJASY_001092 [Halioglobus sp.]|jgi:hypothetical protein